MTRPPGILIGYQRRWMEDPSRMKALAKSRRIGGTWVVALEESMRACGISRGDGGKWYFDAAGGIPQNIISASEGQAVKHLANCREHLTFLCALDGAPRVVKESALRIELSSGVYLEAYAANPRTIRGGEGDVTLDEFGSMPFAEKIWASAAPLADPSLGHPKGFHVRVLGTPLGDDNMFARFMLSDEGRAFSRHTVTIHDAIKDGFPADVEDLRARAGDADMFAQEYECSFLSASSRYIPAELWDKAVYHTKPEDFHRDGYAGYDVARKPNGDLSVCVELERIGDTLWLMDYGAERGMAWTAQEKWVEDVLNRRRRVCIDGTGMGGQFAERLVNKFPSRVESVTFTSQSKEALATGLRLALERGRLRVPDDPDLRRDVLSLRRTITEAGNTRFDAERTKDGHGDRAWALALAIHASGDATARAPYTANDLPADNAEDMDSYGFGLPGTSSGMGKFY